MRAAGRALAKEGKEATVAATAADSVPILISAK